MFWDWYMANKNKEVYSDGNTSTERDEGLVWG